LTIILNTTNANPRIRISASRYTGVSITFFLAFTPILSVAWKKRPGQSQVKNMVTPLSMFWISSFFYPNFFQPNGRSESPDLASNITKPTLSQRHLICHCEGTECRNIPIRELKQSQTIIRDTTKSYSGLLRRFFTRCIDFPKNLDNNLE
jgi:hypothetical protein